jgi:hypothetical protein
LKLSCTLAPKILIPFKEDSLNKDAPRLKDSTERLVDFANHNKTLLGYVYKADLESIGVIFALNRRLTPLQKGILSTICGEIAKANFNEDLDDAIEFINKNKALLDSFNLVWYDKFNEYFTGKELVSNVKIRTSIFNMAGFILANLENPVTSKNV